MAFFLIVEPSQTPVSAQQSSDRNLILPNRLNRAVLAYDSTFFLVDNIFTSSPLEYSSANQVAFDWDLSSYRSSVITVQSKVSVDDETGVRNFSDPVQVKAIDNQMVSPTIQDQTPPQSSCVGEQGFTYFLCQVHNLISTPAGWISILSLLVALGAMAFTWFNRARIGEASGAALERVRESVSPRRRQNEAQVGAFLEVLSGDDTLTGKHIPLYVDKVTLAGRSPQEAELVFDMMNERSVVSRLHCEFREEDGLFKIRDLGSTHGTFLNGGRVPESGDGFVLSEGDRIELGPIGHGGFLLLFRLIGRPEPEGEIRSG